jgi:hypothetical protein
MQTPVLKPKKSLSNLRADIEFGIQHLDEHVENEEGAIEKEPGDHYHDEKSGESSPKPIKQESQHQVSAKLSQA